MGSLAAGFVAACALGVSAYTAYLQRQQVRAQVWPRILSNISAGDQGLRFRLQNRGVGPAIIKSRITTMDGVRVQTWGEFLARAGLQGEVTSSRVSQTGAEHVLAPGEDWTYFALPPGGKQPKVSNLRVQITVCYCSIYDECFVTVDDATRDVKVCAEAGTFQPQAWDKQH
jgi:hypothetical protein